MIIIGQVPEAIDAKQYIEANRGIKVEYVDDIDGILKYAIKTYRDICGREGK